MATVRFALVGVCYMLYSFGDQKLFIFPLKTHVVQKIEIITAMVMHTSRLCVSL